MAFWKAYRRRERLSGRGFGPAGAVDEGFQPEPFGASRRSRILRFLTGGRGKNQGLGRILRGRIIGKTSSCPSLL